MVNPAGIILEVNMKKLLIIIGGILGTLAIAGGIAWFGFKGTLLAPYKNCNPG